LGEDPGVEVVDEPGFEPQCRDEEYGSRHDDGPQDE